MTLTWTKPSRGHYRAELPDGTFLSINDCRQTNRSGRPKRGMVAPGWDARHVITPGYRVETFGRFWTIANAKVHCQRYVDDGLVKQSADEYAKGSTPPALRSFLTFERMGKQL